MEKIIASANQLATLTSSKILLYVHHNLEDVKPKLTSPTRQNQMCVRCSIFTEETHIADSILPVDFSSSYFPRTPSFPSSGILFFHFVSNFEIPVMWETSLLRFGTLSLGHGKSQKVAHLVSHLPPSTYQCWCDTECAYGFRYAIRNQRDEEAKWNPDYDPWSIRQTAVYQQYQSSTNKMVFVLISASDLAKKNLEAAITHAQYQGKQLNAFELHRVLISSWKGNWRLYIRALEEALKVQVFLKSKSLDIVSNWQMNSQIV
jgi:hypothetical protein